MSAKLMGPVWSYEHSFAPQTRRWWATSIASLNPGRVCRELRVDHRINIRRLIRFGLWWLLTVHLFTFTLALGSAMVTGSTRPRRFGPGAGAFPDLGSPGDIFQIVKILVFPYGGYLSIPTGVSSSIHAPLGPLVFVQFGPLFLMPLWMMLLGTSLRQARVRKAHLLRGLCLTLPSGVAWMAVVMGAISIAGVFRSVLNVDPGAAAVAAIFAWLLYHMSWWYLFVHRYLRLRHAAGVVILNTVMSVLLLFIIVIVAGLVGR